MRRRLENGFTLIEIIISVGLLSILAVIIIVNINKNLKDQQAKEYAEFIDKIKSAANVYMAANNDFEYYFESNEYKIIKVDDLADVGLLNMSTTINPITNLALSALGDNDAYKFVKIYKDEKTNNENSNALLIEYPVNGKIDFQYMITYIDGENCSYQYVSSSGEPTMLCTPKANNKNFKGWYYDKDFTNEIKAIEGDNKYTITDNITLYGKWTAKINYEMNDYGACDISEGLVGTKVNICSPEDEEADFIGWFLDSSLKESGPSANQDYTLEKNITLYAKWQKKENNILNIKSFDIKSTKSDYNANTINISFEIADDSGKEIQYYLYGGSKPTFSKISGWKDLTSTKKTNLEITVEGENKKVFTYSQNNINTGLTYSKNPASKTWHLYIRYKNETSEENASYQSKLYQLYQQCSEQVSYIAGNWSSCSAKCWDNINSENKPSSKRIIKNKDKYFSSVICQTTEEKECNTDKICCGEGNETYKKIKNGYKTNYDPYAVWQKVSIYDESFKCEEKSTEKACNYTSCEYTSVTISYKYTCYSPDNKQQFNANGPTVRSNAGALGGSRYNITCTPSNNSGGGTGGGTGGVSCPDGFVLQTGEGYSCNPYCIRYRTRTNECFECNSCGNKIYNEVLMPGNNGVCVGTTCPQ